MVTMITLLKRLGIAALALAIPAFAQAAVLIPGGEVPVFPGETYSYTEELTLDGPVTFSFGFTPYGTPARALTTTIALDSGGVQFGSFVITPDDAVGPSFAHTFLLEGDDGFLARITGAALQYGKDYTLTLAFTVAGPATTSVGVHLSVVPIPLPAAGLLLLGGLGGLGLVARRRRAAA